MAALAFSPSSSPHIKEWLPLPSNLATNDSFADDLIRQFDKKRSNLHKDLEQERNQQQQSRKSSSTSSCQPTPITPTSSSATPATPPVQKELSSPTRSTRNPRRSSAGELLRRSSAFFKTTLDVTWKNISQSHENLRNTHSSNNSQDSDPIQVPSLPETIAIHTTITFPPVAKKHSSSSLPPLPPHLLSPPVISHYPPKPLQYSPITMPAEHYATATTPKPLMHRLSLPALRHNASTSNNNQRSSDGANNSFFIKRKKSSQL